MTNGLTFRGCSFEANVAADKGGGIGTFTTLDTLIEDCDFVDNSAVVDAGGFAAWDSRATLRRCTFDSNSARYGGGVVTVRSQLGAEGCEFLGNVADRILPLAPTRYRYVTPSFFTT